MFTAVEVDEERPFMILTAPTGFEDAPCQATAAMPDGRGMALPMRKVPGGYEALFKPVQVGPHQIHVDIAGREVPKSPVLVRVEPKLDRTKIEVKGLERRKLESCCCVAMYIHRPFHPAIT